MLSPRDPQPEQPEQPERVFGVVAVYDQCAINECREPTVAAAPIQTPDDSGVWWLCEEHADRLPWFEGVHGRRGSPRVYNLSPTCRYNSLGPDLPPCGGAADYVAITGNRRADGLHLSVVSLCARHAKELPVY
jgi:hypothetical protein